MSKNSGKKDKYEKPVVMPLGEIAAGDGKQKCDVGSDVKDCKLGNAANPGNCNVGGQANSGNCSKGGQASSGNCSNGGKANAGSRWFGGKSDKTFRRKI